MSFEQSQLAKAASTVCRSVDAVPGAGALTLGVAEGVGDVVGEEVPDGEGAGDGVDVACGADRGRVSSDARNASLDPFFFLAFDGLGDGDTETVGDADGTGVLAQLPTASV